MKPFVSIIIPVKNLEPTIEKTFEYLLGVDYPRACWEWVIADGGSSDKTVAIIKDWQKKYPFIKLVEIPSCPSQGFARNKAFGVIKGDFLFFTDADCAPSKGWINEMLKHFQQDPKIAAVGGEAGGGFIKEGYYPDFPQEPQPVDIAGHKAHFFATSNVAYRKSAMASVQARFWDRPIGEDVDLSYQLRSKGWKFYFTPKAKVEHTHKTDLGSLRKSWVSYGQAHLPLIDKYVKKNGLQIILQFLKDFPSFAIKAPVKGFIYLGDFHLMHIFAFLFLIGLVSSMFFTGIGVMLLIAVPLILTLYFGYQYVKRNFSVKPKKEFWARCKTKYLTNLSFIQGGLRDFKQYKILCLEPSF